MHRLRDWWLVVPLMIGLGACYWYTGELANRIGKQVWDQCDKWRGLIVLISHDEMNAFTYEGVKFDHNRLREAYLWAWVIMFAASF